MPESISALIRPGFPKTSNDGKSNRTHIEYVGDSDTLFAAAPPNGSEWGDYPGRVEDARHDPIEGTDYATLTVMVSYKFDASESPATGELQETSYELDWLDAQRSMYEHPQFAIGAGGTYELTNEDVIAIELWKKETKIERKKIYKYQSTDPLNGYTAEYDLSTNAQMFARGYEQGIEYWMDKVPVARINETYVNGPPPEGSAGLKETPDGFPNLPSGYEWIRNADRGLRAGGQKKWQRGIEWIGGDKILVDTKNIFWEPPA